MKTKHLPIVIGTLLPVLVILVVSISIFLPTFVLKPQYDFIYTLYDSYPSYGKNYQNSYRVEDGKIALAPVIFREDIVANEVSPALFLYDVERDSTRQITFEEAQEYNLDPGSTSPDGFIVVHDRGHNGIFELFGSRKDDRDYSIAKGDKKKKLKGLTTDVYYPSSKFRFIGWIQ